MIRVVADGVIGSAVHVDKAMGLPTYLLFTTVHVDSWATTTWISFFKRGCLPFRVFKIILCKGQERDVKQQQQVLQLTTLVSPRSCSTPASRARRSFPLNPMT